MIVEKKKRRQKSISTSSPKRAKLGPKPHQSNRAPSPSSIQGGNLFPLQHVLTIDELAEYLKISKTTLYKLARENRIPGRKIGRHWRFYLKTIERWLNDESNVNG